MATPRGWAARAGNPQKSATFRATKDALVTPSYTRFVTPSESPEFTELSNRLAPERVLALLDDYFDRVVPAIGAAGGEALKFIGDAVLAFFPQDTTDAACAMVFEGGQERSREPGAAARTGQRAQYRNRSALRTGRYGNVGSGRRLDFTVIGPDVNLISRIQSVCSTTGHRLLVSERFLTLLQEVRFTAAGSHVLKGGLRSRSGSTRSPPPRVKRAFPVLENPHPLHDWGFSPPGSTPFKA